MSRIAVMQAMGKDVKDLLMALHGTGNDAEDCIYLLQTSFIYHSTNLLSDCRQKLETIIDTEQRIAREIEKLSQANPSLRLYESVPVHLTHIGKNIEKLAELIEKKVCEGTLFSDKAIDEINYLFQRLIDLLRPTSDIILARNEILGNYVKESEGDVARKALEYATLHEERLIEGLCHPAAAPVYLSMLDAMKSIAWHAKQIAMNLMS